MANTQRSTPTENLYVNSSRFTNISANNPAPTNVQPVHQPSGRIQQQAEVAETDNRPIAPNFLPPTIAVIFGSSYFLVMSCILLIVPILQVAIGASFINQCQLEPFIPIYLIVSGSCGTVTIALLIVMGNVWVFRVRPQLNTTNSNSSNYCHPTLYWFAFWILILTYIGFVVTCCISCCKSIISAGKILKA
ncbi:unnamed protein product [Didymodactylos carnosus]|uniref:Uncharacterized protein n=1 Tax=Didymodactylos carnosus TaxID=1234261 RepID=A0A8S2SFY3_9BILA|nr:unnamed protein product [Didymodactylos carnosus]CAF4220992.1 unnamed protein product [Didymodactylos carnosus]